MRSHIVMFALVAAACAGDDDDRAANGPLHTELHVVTTIGGIDELRPEYEFGRVTGLTLLGDGRVAVADGLNDVVRVFERDGTHAFSFGRRGAGPGEFSGLCCLALGPDGALWVRDGGNGRYSAYDLNADSASYRSLLRMAHSDANRHAPLTFDHDGRLIDIGMRADPVTGLHRPHRLHLDDAGTVTAAIPIHSAPDDSTAMKAVQRPVEGGTATLFAYQPFGPTDLTAHSPSGDFAHALSSRYAIDWRAADGALITHITGSPTEGPPLSADERARGEEQITATLRRLGIGRTQLGFGLPERKTPLRELFFDSDGQLWVELQVPQGQARLAHVYSRDGALRKIVSWPAEISLRNGAIRDDGVWGVRLDSLGVASVVRLASPAGRAPPVGRGTSSTE